MSCENSAIDPGPDAVAGSDDASDIEVARVLEAYLAAVEAGQPADPRRLFDEYPHLADRLRACLRVLQVAEQAAQNVTAVPGVPRRSGTGLSSLATLDFGPGEPPQVLLRELPEEPEPLIKPRSAAMVRNGASVGRFQLQGEIARGGMGAILKGRDVDLGRDLAIKVLLEAHQGHPDVLHRFVEEAQIGGQLQHPGVVPVYELGTFPDRRPYFAMKLVKGRTLAALLHERADPAKDLPRFLAIFEPVCQTMAYAHVRGVIHRDLKPSNIMVGSFGEVQVMDWGLAKVLPEGGVADEARGEAAHETVIMTVRSGSAGSGSESQAGSVLGTPAYMAPEQARGEVERIDERADVFGLGAILCEILTGRPPFVGSAREEIRAQAARGDLADALGRLETCGADAELIDLARSCLGPERDKRPRNAGEVAGRMAAYLAGVQERLKAAEMARVAARTKAVEEQKRRRLIVALAAVVLGLVVLGGGGWTYMARQRAERRAITERGVTTALAEAGVWRDQARKATAAGNLDHWATALAAARHAHDLAAQGQADAALRDHVNAELAALEREQHEAQAERRLLDQLETIRGSRSEHWDPKRTDAEYAAAFRAFGIDLDQLDPKEAGKGIAQRSAAVELASYLDEWASRRRKARGQKDEASWHRLLQAAQAADPDPWRVALREQVGRDDREALQRLAADAKALEAQPARGLVLLAWALMDQRDRGQAEQVLRRAWRKDPGDFWVNHELGLVHWTGSRYDKPEEAARFLSAAVSIRPRSPRAHHSLGCTLREQEKHDEAVTVLREALRLKPDFLEARSDLGTALMGLGKLEDAIAEYRAVIRLKPDDAITHNNLGLALHNQGKLEAAIAEYREALRLKPDSAASHTNLGLALSDQGKHDEAIDEHQTAIRLEPNLVGAHYNLGNTLCVQGRLDEAIAKYRAALDLKPDHAGAHNNLGVVLYQQGKLKEAIAEYREALHLRPGLDEAKNLALALRAQGDFTEAIAELRRARDLAKTNPRLAEQIERELTVTEQQASLAARLPAVLAGRIKPVDAAEALGFAQVCYAKEFHGASARFWTEAFRAQPKLAEAMQAENRYNAACAAALAGCRRGKDDPSLDEAAKARWRKQAIDWLQADLGAWLKSLDKATPQARQAILQTLQHWKADPDLAGLRVPTALAKLPEDERKACRALWAEVDALLAKARGGTAP
jgi:serine/threonine-protein kinase